MDKIQTLTPEAREAIGEHVWKIVIPSGVALSIVSFLLGFFINEVARSSAYTKALEDFSPIITNAAKELGIAAGHTEIAVAKAESNAAKIEELTSRIKKLDDDNQSVQHSNMLAQQRMTESITHSQRSAALAREEFLNLQRKLTEFESELRQRKKADVPSEKEAEPPALEIPTSDLSDPFAEPLKPK